MDVSTDGLCSVCRRRSGGEALRLLCAGLIRRLRLCRGGSGALGSKTIFHYYQCSVLGISLLGISYNYLFAFEARRCHSKVLCCNKWLRRMVYNAAARYELIGRYYSGVVSRLCIRSLHAVITVLFHARLNTHGKQGPIPEEMSQALLTNQKQGNLD
jgi:hypothetical protein